MSQLSRSLFHWATAITIGATAIGCSSDQSQSTADLIKSESPLLTDSDRTTLTTFVDPQRQPPVNPVEVGTDFDEDDWRQEVSPSAVAACKVADGLPTELLEVGRGSYWNGLKARGPVGFPYVSSYFFPTEGQINMLAILVSFDDTTKFVEQPIDFWGPQAQEIEKWSEFWSQGKIAYDMTVVNEWVDLPYDSSAAPSDDGVLAADIVERIPMNVQIENYDAIFIYWAHGITHESRVTFGLRLNSVDSRPEAQVDPNLRQMVWSAVEYQYTDSGRLTQQIKEESLWTYLIHEILHETNLNLHAPGNGWATGVGQNHYPTQGGGQSVAITAWEQFLLGWMDDDQVHCIAPDDLATERKVILTPLEIFGGERRALVIPITESEVLVVESRRPIGYSSTWSSDNRGLLAYVVNPQESDHRDHIDSDCGNDPTHTKWAYYLFPDHEQVDPSSWCGARGGDFSPAVINEGEFLTHNGVGVELIHSADDKDVVRVFAT